MKTVEIVTACFPKFLSLVGGNFGLSTYVAGPGKCDQCAWRYNEKRKPCAIQRFQTDQIIARFSWRQQVQCLNNYLVN